MSDTIRCTNVSECTALNCPFKDYDDASFINCLPVNTLKLLIPTTATQLPSNNIDTELFFDFSFVGVAVSSAINGRHFVLPTGSLQTQSYTDLPQCPVGSIDCDGDPDACICTHITELNEKNATIQMVLMAVGDTGFDAHPVHLHGHSFHVLDTSYGDYNPDATLMRPSSSVTCKGDTSCTDPGWTSGRINFDITPTTLRKDTVVVPAGGYVVIRFLTDNPGYWFLHCHVNQHVLNGMALVINERPGDHNEAPLALRQLQCGDFSWTTEDFEKAIGTKPSASLGLSANPWQQMFLLVVSVLIAVASK